MKHGNICRKSHFLAFEKSKQEAKLSLG